MSTLAVPATLRMKANCAARSGTSIPFASLDSSYFLFSLRRAVTPQLGRHPVPCLLADLAGWEAAPKIPWSDEEELEG